MAEWVGMVGQMDEMRCSAYEQNHQSFRALNQQMWQIPLIAMTLTGGLWFGVSLAETQPLYKLLLLLLAAISNFTLCIVLQRLRFVMGKHLEWIRDAYPEGEINAEGQRICEKSFVVRRSFQFLLLSAGSISLILLVATSLQDDWNYGKMLNMNSASYYDKHAIDLAERYEAVSFEQAHPRLPAILSNEFHNRHLKIMDVGAGTGRDAAWLAAKGHDVIAVEPAEKMLTLGRKLHGNTSIQWIRDSLPFLERVVSLKQKFDVIFLSAVWMHVPQNERNAALIKLAHLLKKKGVMYFTLRMGPEEHARNIYRVSVEELVGWGQRHGFQVELLDNGKDLLGRPEVRWQSLLMRHAS